MWSKKQLSRYASLSPIILIVILAVIVISSYLLAGWLMRPVGDDYGWLQMYHSNLSWFGSITNTLATENGRYAQNIFVAVSYGLFGLTLLKLTAFLAVGLFLIAAYFLLQALQKTLKLRPRRQLSLAGSLILFFTYSMLSVTYPWIRGPIDNSFQNILWYGGFVTYTLPFELLIILTSMVVLYRDRLKDNLITWGLLGAISVFIGTFNEMLAIIYAVLLGAMLFGHSIISRFGFKRVKSLIASTKPFLIISAGLLVGLILVYTSPASNHRRTIVEQNAPTTQVIVHSATMTGRYFESHVFGPKALDQSAIAFIAIVGLAIGLFARPYLSRAELERVFRSSQKILLFSVFATVVSVYLSFAVILKGYGLGDTYIVPRFEIIYNVWFCISLLAFGFLSALIAMSFIKQNKTSYPVILLPIAICLLILLNVPNILTQTTNRVKTVAVFSQKWDEQNQIMRAASLRHSKVVVVPLIDIGDSYVIYCDRADSPNNWLGKVKQAYYSVPLICSESESQQGN